MNRYDTHNVTIEYPEKNISDVQYDASALTNKSNMIYHSPLHVNINDATQYMASFFYASLEQLLLTIPIKQQLIPAKFNSKTM